MNTLYDSRNNRKKDMRMNGLYAARKGIPQDDERVRQPLKVNDEGARERQEMSRERNGDIMQHYL